MTFTYDVGQLSTSQLMQVRLLIEDTVPNDQLLQDEEITFILSRYNNTSSACAEACRTIAMKYARQVDLVQGQLKTNYSQRSKIYVARAADFEARGLAGVLPYAGGISASDKQSVAEDTDRVAPDFNRGQFDDLLPVGPEGQQTPTGAVPDTDRFP